MSFQYSLTTVLTYKEQVKQQKEGEYSKLQSQVEKQQQKLNLLLHTYQGYLRLLDEHKAKEFVMEKVLMYEKYLQVLEQQIQEAQLVLSSYQLDADRKRAELVQANMDVATLEKLRDKKKAEFLKEEQKKEEIRMEEFLSSQKARSM